VPLVDDRAVELEHDQKPVGRIGGPEAGAVPASASIQLRRPATDANRTQAL
jgi:hypothetical protein